MTTPNLKLLIADGRSLGASVEQLAGVKHAFVPMPGDEQGGQGGAPAGAPPQGGAPAGAPAAQGGGADPQQLIQALQSNPEALQAFMQDPQGAAQQMGIPPEMIPQIMQLLQGAGGQGGAPGGAPNAQGGAAGAPPADPMVIQKLTDAMQRLQDMVKAQAAENKQLVGEVQKLARDFAALNAKTETMLKMVKELDVPPEQPPAAAPAPMGAPAGMDPAAAMGGQPPLA